MSKLLIDEAPVYFAKTLTKYIGLEKAIILQQVHFWLEVNKRDEKNYYENRYWVYSSFEQWQKEISLGGVNENFSLYFANFVIVKFS